MAKTVKFPAVVFVTQEVGGLCAVGDTSECLCEGQSSAPVGVYHLDHTVDVKRAIIVTATPKQAAPKKRKACHWHH